MSQKPFKASADLRQLREDGYFVQLRGGLLVMRDVPYVNARREVKMGSLISSLAMAGDVTAAPDTHVVHFDGEYPCTAEGNPISQISHQSADFNLGHGVRASHSFSSKPAGGYRDYHHKMTTYAGILSGPAAVLQPGVTARTFRTPEEEEMSVFHYVETASDRVGIGALTEKLVGEKIAIFGVGGTGAYVLDLVAKTPAQEIHLWDKDEFLQHNAFRAPGAPSLEELKQAPKKVDYLQAIYGRMHRGIVAHSEEVSRSNIDQIVGITFAFICMDAGEPKRLLIEKLHSMNIAFVDCGMGLELVDGSLGGILRITASTPAKHDHIAAGRISFDGDGNDVYASNIQVADLNALNAALAVVKWKKIRGFYRDLEKEHHSTYTTDGNMLLNGDTE